MNQMHPLENSSSISFRGRVIFQISLWIGILSFVFAIMRLSAGRMPLIPTIFIYTFTALLCLPAFIVHKTGRSQLAGLLLVLFLFFLGINGAYFNAGIMAPVVVLFVILPIVAVIATGVRFISLIFILPAMGIALAYSLKKMGWSSPMDNPDKYDEIKAIIYLGAGLLVGIISYLYEKNRNSLEQSYEFQRKNFQNLFESTPGCVFILDSECQVVDMNTYGVHLLGESSFEKIQQKKLSLLCQNDFREQFESFIRRIIETKNKNSGDFQFLLADQKKIWLKIYGQTVTNKEGQVQFLGVAHEVTAEKTEALIAELNVKVLNKMVSRKPVREILMEIGHFLSQINPHFLVNIYLLKNGVLVPSESINFPYDYEVEMPTLLIGPDLGSSGSAAYWKKPISCPDVLNDHRWVSFLDSAQRVGVRSSFAQPILFDGRVLGTFGIYSLHLMDVSDWEWALIAAAADLAAVAIESDRLEIESEIQRQHLERIQRMASLGEVSSGIAHEINNPLAIIKIKADIIAKRLQANEMASSKEVVLKDIYLIQETVDRIGKIVKGMKALARNAEAENPQLTAINEVILGSFSFMEESLNLAGVNVRMDIQNSCDIKIKCNSVQLQQVFVNMIQNSIDALATENQKWIKIQTLQEKDRLRIYFEDSGPGIPAEIRAKIMQPFFTTKPPGKGTGIGLSFSWNVISQQGGILRIDDSRQNTCFIIDWPWDQSLN